MIIIILIIIILIIIINYELIMNYEHIIYVLYGFKHDIPTPFYITNKIKQICGDIIGVYKYDFIDIGCGSGTLLNTLFKYKLFRKYIGIEIDKKIYKKAINNRISNEIEIYNLDILDYKFKATNPAVIFMYEPFHDIEYNKAIDLYEKVLKKIKSAYKYVYILYLTGTQYKRQDLHNNNYFNKHGFSIINKYYTGSLLVRRVIYLVEYKNNI